MCSNVTYHLQNTTEQYLWIYAIENFTNSASCLKTQVLHTWYCLYTTVLRCLYCWGAVFEKLWNGRVTRIVSCPMWQQYKVLTMGRPHTNILSTITRKWVKEFRRFEESIITDPWSFMCEIETLSSDTKEYKSNRRIHTTVIHFNLEILI